MELLNAGRRVIFICLIFGAAAGAAPTLAAVPSLSDALHAREDGRRAAAPPVARYVSETGASFVVDRSASKSILVKFENSPEVWVLEAHPAPRGDTIYKNDLGDVMLRATRLGGMTVFTDKQPDGAAVALVGESSPLRLPRIGPAELIQHIRIAASRASRVAQRPINIEFNANDVSAALVADAATAFSEAIVRIAGRSDARKILNNFGKIHILAGKKPSVKIVDDRVLEIRVTPAMGLAGRPSSERIAYAAGAR